MGKDHLAFMIRESVRAHGPKFARNAPEWAIADFGILSAKAVSVPIDARNTTSQAEYLATDAGLKLVFVGDQVQYDKVMSFKTSTPQSRWVIAFDRTAKLSGGCSLYFDGFVRMGAASTRDAEVARSGPARSPRLLPPDPQAADALA